MSITSSCMLVNLRVGMWSGRRLDKAISSEVTSAKHAQEDTLRVNKLIVPKDTIAPVVTAANALRANFYTKTLPWAEQGARAITRMGYRPFLEAHEKLAQSFYGAARHLVRVTYPEARAQAEFRMGDAFVESDYPDPCELSDKFYVAIETDPIPSGADFRVDISKQDAEAIRQQIEERTRSRLNEAAKSVWERLQGVVEHYARTMANADIRFKDATVRNLHDLVEAMPALNIMEDPALDAFAKEVRQTLSWTPKELRDDDAARKSAADEAAAMLAKMDSMMNAFSGMQLQEAA